MICFAGEVYQREPEECSRLLEAFIKMDKKE